MLKPEDFTTGIAIMSQDGNNYKLKYSRQLYFIVITASVTGATSYDASFDHHIL